MSYIEWIRRKVGSRKIFLPLTSVVLWDGNGRILLQHRTDFDIWGLPGGILERDEDWRACARREVAEETGLIAGALTLVGIYDHPRYDVVYPNGDKVQQFTVCFQTEAVGGRLQVDNDETRDLRFVTPDEALMLPMFEWYRDMIRDAAAGGPPTFSPPYSNGNLVDQIGTVRPFIGHALYIGIGASLAVVGEDGRLLLLKHRDEDTWRFPAGYACLGETTSETAVREMREETGLQVQIERLLAVYSYDHLHVTYPNGDQVKNVGALFRSRVLAGDPTLDHHEVEEMAWLDPDDVLPLVSPAQHPYYTAVLNCLQSGHIVW